MIQDYAIRHRTPVKASLAASLLLLAACVLAAAGCAKDGLGGGGGEADILVVGRHGNLPGQFTKPRALAITPDERMVVVDRSGRFQVFDLETGELLNHWRLEYYKEGTPTGISLDPERGTLWVAHTHYHEILEYDLEGNIVRRWGEPGTEPGKMVLPTDVCPDPDGRSVWVTEFGLRSRVMQFTVDGEFMQEWGSEDYEYSDLQRPMAIAVSEDGRIFVADAVNHRVVVFSRDGEELDTWGESGTEPGKLEYPYDLSFAPDGSLYICEYGNSRVSHFSAEGEFLGIWGGPGHKAGELYSPWGVAAGTSGELAVADTYNGRVQVLRRPQKAFLAEVPRL